MAKSKPYNISNKAPKRTTSRKKTVSNKIKETLENTTKIRIDKDRLNDTSSLDTSFLEGRVDAQSRRKVLNSKTRNKKSIDLTILRNIIVITIVLVLLVLTVLALMNHSSTNSKDVKVKKIKEEKIIKIVDDNYLFVGDSHTNGLNFDELDYHYIKMSDDDYTTKDILNDINNIYSYNPSLVFIEVGMNDLINGLDDTEIIANMGEIIDGIKDNRSYAKIYVESLYPINKEIDEFDSESLADSINNERISNLNNMLEELAKDKNVEYLDIYNDIILDDSLNDKYTDDGLSLNDDGYEKVWNLIRKVVDKNGGKKN